MKGLTAIMTIPINHSLIAVICYKKESCFVCVAALYLCSAAQPAVFVFCLWALSVQRFLDGCFRVSSLSFICAVLLSRLFSFFCLWALSVQCCSAGCFRFLSISFICAVLLSRLFSFFVSELYLCSAAQPAVFVFCLWALSVQRFSDGCFRVSSLSFIFAVLIRRLFLFFCLWALSLQRFSAGCFRFLSLSFICAVLISRLFSFFVSELYLCSAFQPAVFVFRLRALSVQCFSAGCFRFLSLSFICAVLLSRLFSCFVSELYLCSASQPAVFSRLFFFVFELYLCSADQPAFFVFRLWALSVQCCSVGCFRVSSLSFICAVLLSRLFSVHISFCVGISYSCLRAVLGRSLGYIPALSLTVTAGYLATGRLATSWRQPIDRSLCTALQIQKAVSANL